MVTGDQTRAGARVMRLMEDFYKRQVTLKVKALDTYLTNRPLAVPALPDNHRPWVAGLKPKDQRKREGAAGVFGSILVAHTSQAP
jgi:hypothetical protein